MKFYDLRKTLGRGTRLWAKLGGFTREDADNADQLAKTISGLMQRVSDLEAKSSAEGVEFEQECPAGGQIRLAHGFQGPVRWYVTHWYGSEYGPQLSTVHTAAAGTLILSSMTKGYAVIRVEPSQYGVSRLPTGYQSVFGPALGVNGFRLSGSSTDPLSLSVASTSTIYLFPYTHAGISIYDGQGWVVRTSGLVSLALSGLTASNNYDVFASWNGSQVVLSLGTGYATTRGTPLKVQDGILVGPTDAKLLYVGTIRATAATTTTSTPTQRFIWSQYNQVDLSLAVTDNSGTTNWSYTLAANTWRQVRGAAANRVEYVCGQASALNLHVHHTASATGASGYWFATGVGLDSTTVNSAQVFGFGCTSSSLLCTGDGFYSGTPAAGYHAVNWLECANWNAVTFYGTQSGSTPHTSGLVGTIRG